MNVRANRNHRAVTILCLELIIGMSLLLLPSPAPAAYAKCTWLGICDCICSGRGSCSCVESIVGCWCQCTYGPMITCGIFAV